MSFPLLRFECPECGLTKESKSPEKFCPLCADGREVLMHCLGEVSKTLRISERATKAKSAGLAILRG